MLFPHIKLFQKPDGGLELVSLFYFLHEFWWKTFLLLYSIHWQNFIVWLLFLGKILGNMPFFLHDQKVLLTLNVPCISKSCVEIKIKLNFYFHTSLWCLKRFYEGLKGIHKTFEATQRSVEIKIQLNFFSSSGIGTERVKIK